MDLAATPSRSKSKPRSSPAKPVAAPAESRMDLCTPSKPTPRRKSKSTASPAPMSPATPSTVRRSRRLLETPTKASLEVQVKATPTPTSRAKRAAPSPKTPAQRETKRQKRHPRKRAYYRKVVYDGGEFEVGDDVYVKRREAAESDAEDPEEEECRVCFRTGGGVMVECDACLGGFHLRCVRPPLRRVPEGDWACPYCEAERAGKVVERPRPPEGKRIMRTAREKLLSSDLWAARIERSVRLWHCIGFRSSCGEPRISENWPRNFLLYCITCFNWL
jgi:origin recognition complex subunit 1